MLKFILTFAALLVLLLINTAIARDSEGLPEVRFSLKTPAVADPEGGLNSAGTENTVPGTAVQKPQVDSEFYELASAEGKEVKLGGIGNVRMIPLNKDYLVVIPAAKAAEAAALFGTVEHVAFSGKDRVYYLCAKKLFNSKKTAAGQAQGGQ